VNKNELAFRQIIANSEISQRKFDLARTIAQYALIAYCVYAFCDMVVKLGVQSDEATITALSKFVTSMSLDRVVHSGVTLLLGVGWYLDRKGKKRAISKLGTMRKKIEAEDPHNGSSNLNEVGDTPSS
jgi:hypothetical protein